MNFTSTHTIAIRTKRKTIIAFLVVFLITMFASNILGIEKGLLRVLFSIDAPVDSTFTHYPLVGFLAITGFIFYIAASSIRTFFTSIFEPKMTYSDVVALKHIDIPFIPDQDRMYGFMQAADKVHHKGAVHLSNKELSHWNIDQFGNRLG